MKRRKVILSLRSVLVPFLVLTVLGCVGKKPDDDVALIKQVLGVFERGIDQRSTAVLDSVSSGEIGQVSSGLLDSLSAGRELKGARITNKSFTIVRNRATVEVVLALQYTDEEEKAEQADKPLSLFLDKKKGKWRISGFSTSSRSEQEGGE